MSLTQETLGLVELWLIEFFEKIITEIFFPFAIYISKYFGFIIFVL